jgi:hypothetical protein
MIQTLNNNVILTQEKHIDNISDQFENIVTNLTMFKTHISLLQQQVRILDKTVKKQMKVQKIKIKGVENHPDSRDQQG